MRRKYQKLSITSKFLIVVCGSALFGTVMIMLIGNYPHITEMDRGFINDIPLNDNYARQMFEKDNDYVERILEIDKSNLTEDEVTIVLKSITKLTRYMMMSGGNSSIGQYCINQKEEEFGECIQRIYDNSPELKSQFERNDKFMREGIGFMESHGAQIMDIPFFRDYFEME